MRFLFMCMFSYPNLNENTKAYKYGITRFECGGCPECLGKKSRLWALRCGMEAKSNVGMMVTLTYDTYVYDSQGNIIGENLNLQNPLDKKDIQKFFKRLRAKFPDNKIKYLCAAERGKRTNRPHYHALIFGLLFDDLVYYKKSNRGNIIYRSKTLEKIWHGGREKKGGICTVDCINPSVQVARYCTKYCAKDSGMSDTFMLFSRGIGDDELYKNFNGKNYYIDGREYPIPRIFWKKYIEQKYNIGGYSKYIKKPKIPFVQNNFDMFDKTYYRFFGCVSSVFYEPTLYAIYKRDINKCRDQEEKNEKYRYLRDNDPIYIKYVAYWKEKGRIYEKYKLSDFDRIRALPDKKYRSYKAKALKYLIDKKNGNIPYTPPRSNSHGAYNLSVRRSFSQSFAVHSRHYTANDNFFEKIHIEKKHKRLYDFKKINENDPF